MGKRKKAAPKRLGEDVQTKAAWNMTDSFRSLKCKDSNPGVRLATSSNKTVSSPIQNDLDFDKQCNISSVKLTSINKDTTVEKVIDEHLKDMLTQCLFYLTVKTSVNTEASIPLGVLSLVVEVELLPDKECSEFWIYVNDAPNKSLLYFECGEEVYHYSVHCDLKLDVLSALNHKGFSLQYDRFDSETHYLYVKVFLLESFLPKFEQRCNILELQRVMEHFYGITAPVYDSVRVTKHDFELLYDAVKEHHLSEGVPFTADVAHPDLVPTLRPYQIHAVKWMLMKERRPETEKQDKLHCLFTEVSLPDGKTVYYNKYSGHILLTKPKAEPLPTGGILADEMGLGKTVEVLACVLMNPRQNISCFKDKLECKIMKNSIKKDDDSSLYPCIETKPTFSHVVSSDSLQTVKVENDCSNNALGSPFHAQPNATDSCFKESKSIFQNATKIEDSTNTFFQSNALQKSSSNNEINCLGNINTKTNRSRRKNVFYGVIDHGEKVAKKLKLKDSNHLDGPINQEMGLVRQTIEGVIDNNTIDPIEQTIEEVISDYKIDPIEQTIEEVIVKYSGKVTKRKNVGPKKINVHKAALMQWYNELLLETKYRKTQGTNLTVQCLCGDEKTGEKKVCCVKCSRWQHRCCVNYYVGGDETYLCPSCWQDEDPVVSGATLIVSPDSICDQWVSEVRKHIIDKDFKVMVYGGVQKEGFVQPGELAQYDVVITTYETLSKELHFAEVSTDSSNRLRFEKRFVAAPSPLPCVGWWRMCLDEAQMVESVGSKAAEMARKVTAVHRWAITGTPMQKSINDLFGLLQFLGLDPYNEQRWWQTLLYEPYCHRNYAPLHEVMNQIMWRTRKRDVFAEIGVPPQLEETVWLHFSPVEEYFYRIQEAKCKNDFRIHLQAFQNLDIPLDSLCRNSLPKILAPLLTLRQACLHPGVIKGNTISLNRGSISMEELLESMIKKTKTDCEEALRVNISAINGIAGIHVIREEWAGAAELYRDVLRVSESYKESLKTDKLQLIHALHNLTEILDVHKSKIPPTLRDDKLREEAKSLEEKYMAKHEAQFASSQQTVANMATSVKEVESSYHYDRDHWWLNLLSQIVAMGFVKELLSLISQELIHEPIWAERLSTYKSLEFRLHSWSQSVLAERNKVVNELGRLQNEPARELVNEAVDCHLRQKNYNRNKIKLCQLCRHESLLKRYESHLFAVSKKEANHSLVGNVLVLGQLNQGTWKPNRMEVVLKKVFTYARQKKLDKRCLEDGQTHFKWLELLKKEFKNLRALWSQLSDKVSAIDELDMSKIRLRVRCHDEPSVGTLNKKNLQKHKTTPPLNNFHSQEQETTIYILEPFQVDSYELKLNNEREMAKTDLLKKTGQLMYLENLRKKNDPNINPEPCPICHGDMQEKWSVLQCGHCYCLECVHILIKESRFSSLKCPICRDKTPHGSVSYVNFKSKLPAEEVQGTSAEDQAEVKGKGSQSTKMEAIVKCLLMLRKKDPAVKVLVFSTWESVLNVLAEALIDNNIAFLRMSSSHRTQNTLRQFKLSSGDHHVTVLLLPVRSGAKGLNLVEATHVILAEPILNPSDELQALGRVHRIGQTRETVVHRFLIHDTIEERIHHAMQAGVDQWNEHRVTLKQFWDLFPSGEDTGIAEEVQPGREDVNFWNGRVSFQNDENSRSSLGNLSWIQSVNSDLFDFGDDDISNDSVRSGRSTDSLYPGMFTDFSHNYIC